MEKRAGTKIEYLLKSKVIIDFALRWPRNTRFYYFTKLYSILQSGKKISINDILEKLHKQITNKKIEKN